jgi:SPP1 gp7 family putative phage head morphogenesis protein
MAKANQRGIPHVTFEQARRFFRGKVALTRDEFDLLVDEVKRRAFTVAYVTSMDLIRDVKSAIDSAIEIGTTLADFQAALNTLIDERGWTGTTPWHAETVFRTNIQSAYGAGRFEQQSSVAETYPYAEYSAIIDGREREEHGALDGTIAPIDSAFWQIHYPPWDYNCRCSAIPMTAEDVEGREIERGTGPAVENDFTSPAVGADWEPDLSRFDADEAEQVRDMLRKIGS